MERRVLIAVLLSFLVLFGYQLLFSATTGAAPAKASAAAQRAGRLGSVQP